MSQSVAQIVRDLIQARAAGAPGRSGSNRIRGPSETLERTVPFDMAMARTTQQAAPPTASANGQSSVTTDAGESRSRSQSAEPGRSAVQTGDRPASDAESADGSKSPAEQLAEALAGLAEQVQARDVELPAKVDPDNPAQVARLVAEILSRRQDGTAGPTQSAELPELHAGTAATEQTAPIPADPATVEPTGPMVQPTPTSADALRLDPTPRPTGAAEQGAAPPTEPRGNLAQAAVGPADAPQGKPLNAYQPTPSQPAPTTHAAGERAADPSAAPSAAAIPAAAEFAVESVRASGPAAEQPAADRPQAPARPVERTDSPAGPVRTEPVVPQSSASDDSYQAADSSGRERSSGREGSGRALELRVPAAIAAAVVGASVRDEPADVAAPAVSPPPAGTVAGGGSVAAPPSLAAPPGGPDGPPLPGGELFDASANAERVARAVAAQLHGRGFGSIRLRLEPPGLGELRVQMALGRDSVRVALLPSSNSAAELLAGQLHHLRDALQSHGLTVARLEVEAPRAEQTAPGDGRGDPGDRPDGQPAWGQDRGRGDGPDGRRTWPAPAWSDRDVEIGTDEAGARLGRLGGRPARAVPALDTIG